MFIIWVILFAAKIQIGIIKAVNNKKHKEIPSTPKVKFKLYSGINGTKHSNWYPGFNGLNE